MFNKGDIVEICYDGNDAFPDCPALNLRGTTAEIAKVSKIGNLNTEYRYELKFLKIVAKKPDILYGGEEKLYWREKHLLPINNLELPESEIMDLFEE